MDCGYRENAAALEFDHVRGEKKATVASLMYRGWDEILAEMQKCDVRCANCHAIVTNSRGETADAPASEAGAPNGCVGATPTGSTKYGLVA